jgi:glutathione S-transferase
LPKSAKFHSPRFHFDLKSKRTGKDTQLTHFGNFTSEAKMILVIGDKNLSSWSLRPWLVAKQFEIPFEEKLIRLDRPETRASIQRLSPSGKVPALIDGDLTVSESLAICEYLADKYPEKKMWPTDLKTRAIARSISHEMHAGFSMMRSLMSHNIQKRIPRFDWSQAQADVERVLKIWDEALKKSGGPFLFGDFTIADAMYAPVCNRFITYDVPLTGGAAKDYVTRVRELPAHQEWIQAALKEN